MSLFPLGLRGQCWHVIFIANCFAGRSARHNAVFSPLILASLHLCPRNAVVSAWMKGDITQMDWAECSGEIAHLFICSFWLFHLHKAEQIRVLTMNCQIWLNKSAEYGFLHACEHLTIWLTIVWIAFITLGQINGFSPSSLFYFHSCKLQLPNGSKNTYFYFYFFS